MSPRRSKRALGIDLGSKRIGLALSDASGTIASPYSVIERTNRHVDYQRIAEVVADEDVAVIVVGLPLSLSGEPTRAAIAATAEAERIATVVGVPVELHDERMTTVTADERLRHVRGPERRRIIDMHAAAVILQSWLDHDDRGAP